ncbi:hypothetical protein QR680_019340 [Steinernema hermaphroditum]|uniref:Uncharacterized protein n=1 Tax=Steinernema hermaphroditum TaxID=289476 RepID=A0AA39LAY2_9BILA|nr:hypothetical protein QR680_019340 [Steinernema hermaphroditum]
MSAHDVKTYEAFARKFGLGPVAQLLNAVEENEQIVWNSFIRCRFPDYLQRSPETYRLWKNIWAAVHNRYRSVPEATLFKVWCAIRSLYLTKSCPLFCVGRISVLEKLVVRRRTGATWREKCADPRRMATDTPPIVQRNLDPQKRRRATKGRAATNADHSVTLYEDTIRRNQLKTDDTPIVEEGTDDRSRSCPHSNAEIQTENLRQHEEIYSNQDKTQTVDLYIKSEPVDINMSEVDESLQQEAIAEENGMQSRSYELLQTDHLQRDTRFQMPKEEEYSNFAEEVHTASSSMEGETDKEIQREEHILTERKEEPPAAKAAPYWEIMESSIDIALASSKFKKPANVSGTMQLYRRTRSSLNQSLYAQASITYEEGHTIPTSISQVIRADNVEESQILDLYRRVMERPVQEASITEQESAEEIPFIVTDGYILDVPYIPDPWKLTTFDFANPRLINPTYIPFNPHTDWLLYSSSFNVYDLLRTQ